MYTITNGILLVVSIGLGVSIIIGLWEGIMLWRELRDAEACGKDGCGIKKSAAFPVGLWLSRRSCPGMPQMRINFLRRWLTRRLGGYAAGKKRGSA